MNAPEPRFEPTIDEQIDRMMVDRCNRVRRAHERLRHKARRAEQQLRFADADALWYGVGAAERDLRDLQPIVARACAPWFEVRA